MKTHFLFYIFTKFEKLQDFSRVLALPARGAPCISSFSWRSVLFLNARSSRLSSVTCARLSFMRITSSPLVPNSCMTWNRSMTISACGKFFLTMPIMLSEKPIVISLTFLRLSSSIFSRYLVTSATVVPLTAATNVPFLPWPSLLERKVNRSCCSAVSSFSLVTSSSILVISK